MEAAMGRINSAVLDAPVWEDVSIAHPCPSCGATRGCSVHADGDFVRFREVFLAALGGEGVAPRRQLDFKRVGRECGVHLDGVRVDPISPLIRPRRSVRGGGVRKVPGAVLASNGEARRQRLPGLLRERGYSDADVKGIMYGNWVRFFKEA